jgi:hypothetical protein
MGNRLPDQDQPRQNQPLLRPARAPLQTQVKRPRVRPHPPALQRPQPACRGNRPSHQLAKKTIKQVALGSDKPANTDIPPFYSEMLTLFKRTEADLKKSSVTIAEIHPCVPEFSMASESSTIPVEELRFEDLSPLDQQYSGFRPLMLTPLPIELGVQEDEVPLFNQGHLAATAGFRLDHVPARNRTRRLRQDCCFSHQERSDCQPDRQRE